MGKPIDEDADPPHIGFLLPYDYIIAAWLCLDQFHIFPEPGGLWDQDPRLWHDLKLCFALLGEAIDIEIDDGADDGLHVPVVNAEDM